MYQEKHSVRKKKIRFRKSFVLLTSVIVLTLGIIGGTVAFLIANTEKVNNNFTYGYVSCAVNEDPFTGGTKSNVTIQNTGDTTAYIRARIVVTWKDAAGNVFGKAPVAPTDYTLQTGSGWTTGTDGYWYYKSAVESGESTSALIKSCTNKETSPDEAYDLSVEIIADAIQSQPANAVTEAWPGAPNMN